MKKTHKAIRLYEWSTVMGSLCRIENKVFSFWLALKDEDVTCKKCLARIKKESGDGK